MTDFQDYLEGLPAGTEFTIPRTDTTRAVWGTWVKRDVAGMTFFEQTEGRQAGAMQAGSYFSLSYEEPVRAALANVEDEFSDAQELRDAMEEEEAAEWGELG